MTMSIIHPSDVAHAEDAFPERLSAGCSPLTLEGVSTALAQDGSQGFALVRRFLKEYPRQWRALARAGRAVPWTKRTDFSSRHVRFAMLGSFSTDNLTDALSLAALERGLIATSYHAPFNQASVLVREQTSDLYATPPDVVVFAIDPADRFLPPWRVSGEMGAETAQGEAERFLDDLVTEMTLVHERSGALVVVHNFTPPEFRPLGLQGWRQESADGAFYLRLNLALLERCRTLPWAHVVDVARAQALSEGQWPTLHQTRFLGAYRLPGETVWGVVREYAAIAAALRGFAKKCLVVDLDNTLWGGVVAEDGVSGVALGGGYPGNIYRELQYVIRALHDRGVILAINSKNNEADAWEPFRQREEMVLQPHHFSAWRINWQDKATNVREIAQELSLGIDSLVVLDDNPVERAWMENAVPEVHVLPAQDPLDMLRFLSCSLLFDGLELSREDRLRAQSYAAAAQRRAVRTKATNLDEFLLQLNVQVEVFAPQENHWGRVAQLTQKTNQFNLTTHRYTQDQLLRMSTLDEVSVLCCSVRDRFADEGIVGVVILRKQGQDYVTDSFLLSCRVLGRGVERALLWATCQRVEAWGGQRLLGEYRRSEKNEQTAQFFPEQGFTLVQETPASSLWRLSLPAPQQMMPNWITLTVR
jgi:FkbH-like protein